MEKHDEPPKFPVIGQNILVTLMDRHGRILWISDTPTEETPYHRQKITKLVHDRDIPQTESAMSQCLIHNEPGITILKNVPAPATMLHEVKTVHARNVLFPIDFVEIAICAITQILPINYEDISQEDLQLLRLLADDCSVKEAAAEMHRSDSAIDTRIRNLKSKLGVKGIGGMVAKAIRFGLI